MDGSSGLADLPSWAAELVADAPVARLGLLDATGAPRVLPVTFALCAGAVVSAIDDHKPKRSGEPARVRWLRASPRAALTVDRYAEDWTQLAWVQLLGAVEVIDVTRVPEAIAALCERYPPYRRRAPSGPVLRLGVQRALCWRAAEAAPRALR